MTRTRVSHDARFARTVDAIAAFRAVNGRYPRRNTGDRIERKLGDWLYHYRRALTGVGHATLTPERRQLLDRALPEWWVSPRAAAPGTPFTVKVDQIARFYAELGYLPQQSKYADPEEKRLAWALNAYRRDARAGTIHPDRAAHLDQVIPGWRSARELRELAAAS